MATHPQHSLSITTRHPGQGHKLFNWEIRLWPFRCCSSISNQYEDDLERFIGNGQGKVRRDRKVVASEDREHLYWRQRWFSVSSDTSTGCTYLVSMATSTVVVASWLLKWSLSLQFNGGHAIKPGLLRSWLEYSYLRDTTSHSTQRSCKIIKSSDQLFA